MRRIQSKRERGTIYLAVLGASMLVTLLGVSALMAVRVQRQAGELDHAASEASVLARSAVEWGLLELQRDTNWRTTYQHDTWRSQVQLGRGSYRFKLVDMIDTDLSDDPDDPVMLIGEGVVAQSVRLERIDLKPVDLKDMVPGDNLLTDDDFESGHKTWRYPNTTMTMAGSTLVSYEGTMSLLVTDRTAASDGPWQDVSDPLINGMTYDTSVWIISSTIVDQAMIRLTLNSTRSGEQTYDLPSSTGATIGLSWQQLTGSVTPRWEGDLIEARWQVLTATGTGDFSIDEASFLMNLSSARTLQIIPSSGQQTLP